MVSRFPGIQQDLRGQPRRWLVTGAAGFIGSHLVEDLLLLDQIVVGLDNFSTGYKKNIDCIQSAVDSSQWENFTFIQGDIRDPEVCAKACAGADYVLHQAALGSVPRSIEDPLTTNAVNVDGFLQMLSAARDAGCQRFVYASSSSVYGDAEKLPKIESDTGNPLSPYAVTKTVNELYACVFQATYGIQTVGLRYFNVFGPRQDPQGAYAAVIPRWIGELLSGETPQIFGDGETSRDFCYVKNAVQANILAAVVPEEEVTGQAYNVSYGDQTTLNELYTEITTGLSRSKDTQFPKTPEYADFRQGDVRHSRADISRGRELLGYHPQYSLAEGLSEALEWYVNEFQTDNKQ